MGQLYKITFKTSGKSYIGISSVSAKHRFMHHAKPSNKNVLGMAFRKYGKDDATLTILKESDSFAYLCRLEIESIISHGTKVPNGYNVTDGGEGVIGIIQSEESKIKRKRFGVLNHSFGKSKSESHRRKISETKKGVPSPAKGKKNEKIRIRNLSPENMAHIISVGKKNKGRAAATRMPIYAINIKTEERQYFAYQRLAAEAIGCVANSISNCLCGRRKTANGYRFEVANNA